MLPLSCPEDAQATRFPTAPTEKENSEAAAYWVTAFAGDDTLWPGYAIPPEKIKQGETRGKTAVD
jgi:hypothetical protein